MPSPHAAATDSTVPGSGTPAEKAIEGGARTPLPLDQAGVWLVEGGYADVFATMERGRGRRRHLFRCESGAVLVGGDTGDEDGLALIAVGSLGSSLRRTDIPEPQALEHWAARLADAAAGPDSDRDVVARTGELALDGGRSLHGDPRRLFWVRVLEGGVSLLGATAIGPGDGHIPLAGRSWLRAEGAVRLGVDDVAPAMDLLPGIACLQQAALAHLQRRWLYEAATLDRQALVRRRSAAREFEAALHDLAAVAGAAAPDASSAGDPLLTALAALGLDAEHSGPRSRSATEGGPAEARLESALETLSLRQRKVILLEGWWRSEGLPVLGWWGAERHPVALRADRRGWRAQGQGIDLAVTSETAALIAPDAVQIYRPLPRGPLGLKDLFEFARRGLGRDAWRVLVAGLITAILALAAPAAAGLLFDNVLPLADRSGLAMVVLGLAALAAGGASFETLRAVALLRIEAHLDSGLQAALIDRLLRMPARFFRAYSAGDMADRALGIQGLREVLTGSTLTALFGGVFGLVSFGLMAVYDVRLALVAFGLMLVLVGAEAALSYGQLRHEREQLRRQGRLDGFVLQLLVGVSKLKAAAAEPRAMAQWAKRFAQQKRRFVSARRWQAWQQTLQAGAPTLAFVVLFAAIMTLAKTDAHRQQLEALVAIPGDAEAGPPLSTGSFIAFAAAFGQLLAAFSAMSQAASRVLGAAPLLERARPILTTSPHAAEQVEPLGELRGAIDFRKVSFRYVEGGPLILNELDLSVPAGAYAAIVGSSGGGKSTILRLMLGFERQEAGEIFFDGRAASRLATSALRRQMGVVLQHARVTGGSLYDNIIGATSLGVDDAWAAARMVGLDRDIEAMPMGMHTVLQDGGASLSGGQRQRLVLARALVGRPRILLLDEATSALDNRTQSVVGETLERLSVTRIVIAHRLTTIRGADRIFLVERGRLADAGSYDELIDRCEAFQRLVRRQLL